MFKLEIFPALDGDALVLSWGDPERPHRILIDAGRESTANSLTMTFGSLPDYQRVFELLVISHIDADHIAGVIKLLSDSTLTITFKEFWFNAYHHLGISDWETFGVKQGDALSDVLQPNAKYWNTHFGGKAVAIETDGALPCLEIEGLKLTLLSPTHERLQALAKEWEKWLQEESLKSGQAGGAEPPPVKIVPEGFEAFGAAPDIETLAAATFIEDKKAANGSSIAFAAEFKGKRILLAADAHPSILISSLTRLPPEECHFDLVKLPHHASKSNVSKALLDVIDCQRFAISTNGSRHEHPDPEAIARVLQANNDKKHLYFNYRHTQAILWDNDRLMEKYNYQCTFCQKDNDGYISIAI